MAMSLFPNTTTSSSHSPTNLEAFFDHAREGIRLVMPPLFLLVGLPGNVISMNIWARRIHNSPGSTSLLLTVMCATDTYVLFQGCLRNWVLSLTHSKWDLRYHLGCALPLFLFTFFSDLSVWIIMLLCLERFLCVVWPVRAKRLCVPTHGAIALCIVVLILAVINMHFFWTITPDANHTCDWIHTNGTLFTSAWPLIDFTVYSFLPLFVVIVLNSIILLILRNNHARLRQGQLQSAGDRRPQRRLTFHNINQKHSRTGSDSDAILSISANRSFSISAGRLGRIQRTIIWMTISHFAFTMPIVNFYLAGETVCVDHDTKASCDFVECICLMLQLANHFTHIFIYSVTSSIFTEDLVKRMPVCQFILRNSRIRREGATPTTATNMPLLVLGPPTVFENNQQSLKVSPGATSVVSADPPSTLLVPPS